MFEEKTLPVALQETMKWVKWKFSISVGLLALLLNFRLSDVFKKNHKVFSINGSKKFTFSNFCFESRRRDDGGIYIEDIITSECNFKKPGGNNSDLFHKENCLLIQTQIRALQEIETAFQTTDLGKILKPKFILAGSVAEGTKVGSIANELDVTMKFEVNIKIIL